MKHRGSSSTITGHGKDLSRKTVPSLFVVFALLFVATSPAASQAIRGLDAARGLRTNRFDIFFPASLEAEGRRLASFADSVYADLEAFFGPAAPNAASGDTTPAWKIDVPGGRIPVLVSDASYDLNGYYTAYPSNRIVIYAKSASPRGSLASMDDELRSVFVHELTHLVTMNARSPFWSFLARVMGDIVAPPAWIMPSSLVEGSAVWVESRYLGGSASVGSLGALGVTNPAAGRGTPKSGRLHDPAALEAVFADILAGRGRGMWETAGLADFPGAGNLPYIYGALFAEYLEAGYGAGIIRDLWGAAADGNIFTGFAGTLTSRGLLEKRTGKTPKVLWAGFLDWLEVRAKTAAAKEAAAPDGSALASGRIAAFCVAGDTLYYLDGQRRAVLSLGLGKPGAAPRLAFAADSYLEAMRPMPDGQGLEVDWVRPGPGEIPKPARYEYSFASGKLRLIGDRAEEPMGAAKDNLARGAPEPFLHGAATDPATGTRYGLVRMGTLVTPARIASNGGGMELLRSPLAYARGLALGKGRIILGAATPDGLSRIAILDGLAGADPSAAENQKPRLYLQKAAPAGGAWLPAPCGESSIIYRAEMGDGQRELRITPVDPTALSSGYDTLEAVWMPLEEFRAALATSANLAGAPAQSAPALAVAATLPVATPTPLRPTLFPRLASTTRYPYLSQNSGGLVARGQDLTERLSWQARGGLRWDVALPEEALGLTLLLGGQSFTLSLSDQAAGARATPTRLTYASLSHAFWHGFVPLQNTFWTNAYAQFAGLQPGYAIDDVLAPAYSYRSFAGSASAGFTTMGEEPFAPFDERGFSAQVGADGEILPGIGRAIALKASLALATARPGLRLSLYGAWSPDGSARFSPGERSVASNGSAYLSALSIPYPSYGEYMALDGGSSWYCFAEAKARLASVDLWRKPGPIDMPFVPAWAIRRFSLFAGFRVATLENSGSLLFPASAFARFEAQFALLAGLAPETSLSAHFEAAWAFDVASAGGNALSLSYGFGASL